MKNPFSTAALGLLLCLVMSNASAADAFKPGPACILTGPEGGFTDEERAAVRGHPNAVPISLGPRILRAETAALAALTAYMALAGDWR